MILLDTCTLLWLSTSPEQLSSRARELISQYREEIYISPISAFEIALKAHKQKLSLPLAPLDWFQKVADFHRLKEAKLDAKIFILSIELPPIHKDPLDRILIATAQSQKWILLSPDEKIHQYPSVKIIW